MDTDYLVREYLTHLHHLVVLSVAGEDRIVLLDFFIATQPLVPGGREYFFIGDEVRLPYMA